MADNSTNSPCRSGLPLFGLMLAIGLIISTYIFSNAAIKATSFNDVIKVRGFATKHVQSDFASWTIYLKTKSDPDNISTASKRLEQDKNKLIAYLKAHNIKTKDILVKPMDISETYKINEKGYNTDKISYYKLRLPVHINTTDVYAIAKAESEINKLMQKDIILSVSDPSYSYLKANKEKADLLTKATQNALQRANIIAQSGGSELGHIKAARLGSFKVMSSTETNEEGYSNSATIDKKITAVVTVDFSVK
ncbi:MAG: SIMPL domain-containing protein [Alphaproteobacteria bacterium]|nr:SIMPL domain-containing protein [Alphaproteobacteria bacterium]